MKLVESPVQPLVSVVIPCYNSGGTILQAVESISRQTYSNIEILIVNDGSTELRTLERLKALEDIGFKVISHASNRGLPSARNSGFGASLGDYILFLDADDWFSETMIEEMTNSIPAGRDNYFIYTDIFFEGERQGPSERVFKPFSQLVINRLPYALMFKKSSISWAPLYDEAYTQGLEDWNLNLTFLELGFTPIRVSKPFFHYHASSQGMFVQETQKRFFSIWKKIRDSRHTLYSNKNVRKLVKAELKDSNLRTVFLPLILLFISKLPINTFLDRVFNTFRHLRRH